MSSSEKRALRVAGHELAALADDLPNPAWIAYADGAVFWFNRAWYDYIGTTPNDIQELDWASVHHPDELAQVTEVWTQAVASGNAVELTFPLKGKDGNYRPFLTRVAPIRDSSGAVVRWFGTNVDISAQVAVEERLRRAEEDWRHLFDEMQEGFVVLDMVTDDDGAPCDAVIVKTNKHFERLTGLPIAEAVGLSVRKIAGNAAPAMIETYARVVATGQSETFEVDVETLGRSYEIRAYRHSAQHVAAVYLDISARRAGEAEARRAQENLMRVSRLSAMGAMASTLAHELNQPIGAAANFLGAAREQLRRGETIDRDALDALLVSGSESCVRAGEIIRHIRQFTVSGHIASDPENIAALVGQAVSDFKGTPAAKGIRFTVTAALDLPLVVCDRVQIEQVLINLFTNSAQAMSALPKEAKSIAVELGFDGPDAILRIEDRGPGFGEREPETLFEPFWSTKDVSLGLGLPLCRTIVEAHGGSIAAERGTNGGACFVISLPIASDRRPA